MTKLRTIAATAITASAFGGAIGALATAAVQSQAAADTAAAVQQVQDRTAEQTLGKIENAVKAIYSPSFGGSGQLATIEQDLLAMQQNLHYICEDTRGSAFASCR